MTKVECVNDADDDGICDELEIVGCMDTLACNFTSYATDSDESLCVFPMDAPAIVPASASNDADGDGVCDENEVPGCHGSETLATSAKLATEDNLAIANTVAKAAPTKTP